MIFLMQFGIKSTCKFFKDPKGRVQFCQSLKNLLVLIYQSKLHSKSCVYLRK